MKVKLSIENQPSKDEKIIEIDYTQRLEIGRESKDLAFPKDLHMSRKHAGIYVNGEKLRVEDLTSANG